jgi:hypothetical protein
MKHFSLFLFLLSFLNAITQNRIEELSHTKEWHALLHYNKTEKSSKILTKSFFLTENGKTNPLSELKETIARFNTKLNNGTLAQCQYPARYLWLSQYIDYNKNTMFLSCDKLTAWNLNQNIDSISTVFVSGFLGNPASAFGHSFFKINKKRKKKNRLLDNTISFGAILPQKYTMLSYMYNGMTGGYKASYSDKYFYMDDMVYTKKEQREMWEYKLKLTEYQKKLFIYHLWELKQVHFPYYFFNRNCGYYSTELLDLISDKKLLTSGIAWYAPIETFYAIDESNIVDSVTYYPSEQYKIYHAYKNFSKKEKEIIATIVEKSNMRDFHYLSIKEQVDILDFLLLYYSYKLKQIDQDTIQYNTIEKKQNTILLQRFLLPIEKDKDDEEFFKEKVTQRTKPMMIETSIMNKNEKNRLFLRFTPFNLDTMSSNDNRGDILSILDIALHASNENIKIDSLDLINIRRLKINKIPFEKDSIFSWKIQMGFRNNINYDFFAEGGIGYSWEINDNIMLYSMANLSWHSSLQHYRISPTIGLYATYDNLKIDMQYGKENIRTESLFDIVYSASIQYNFMLNRAIYMSIDKKEKESFRIGLKWFF